jgi:hypothetical protein
MPFSTTNAARAARVPTIALVLSLFAILLASARRIRRRSERSRGTPTTADRRVLVLLPSDRQRSRTATTLTFSIRNKPAWAGFTPRTGSCPDADQRERRDLSNIVIR